MLFNSFGLTHHNVDRATPGFTLFAAINHDQANLLNIEGEIVHQWQLKKGGINHCMLLPNGNLFIGEGTEDGPTIPAGKGGWLREYDWDGNVVWEHHDENQHHDARRLPNGNTVYIAWNKLSVDDAKRIKGGMAGTENAFDAGGPYEDVIREVDADGKVVWEWHSTELDMDKYSICPLCKRHEWAHANTCAPLPNGDIMVSYRVLNLLIIIDRQTGKIKWEHHDIDLGHQHDCHMLDNGNVLVYANGMHGGDIFYSRILEFDPDSKETAWEYSGKPVLSFFSPHISGMQRLDSGNTLICEGGKGCIFEVTPEGDIVWQYISDLWTHSPFAGDVNWIFRAYRYAADSPQIQNRV
ncbi:MAG: PQQ-binding-like beta-propeller repeat protein [Rhodospirillaceae bacterium]|nr:PQQ-binding-like beta-propeller repeat protein [Rhodospirillaceae bacterium]